MTEQQMTPDLRRFGYAPGGYWCMCSRCFQRFDGDKRAWTCRACAEKEDASDAG